LSFWVGGTDPREGHCSRAVLPALGRSPVNCSCPRCADGGSLTRRGPPGGGPLAWFMLFRAPVASQLGADAAEEITARWKSCCDAAGVRPLASCRSALAKAPRRHGPRVKARGADGGEDGPPRGRRRGRAAAAHLRAWRRRRPGRRHAGRSRAVSA